MKRRKTFLLIGLTALIILIYTQVTIFVIQPIGAIPDGRTIVIWRAGKLNFIDSADGVCGRESHGVSLLCRMAVLGAVAKNNTVLLRLPYSETLYLVSTGGQKYDR